MHHLSMTHCISTLDDLRAFVEETICEQKHLLLGAFQFHEKILVRNGRPCSMHFFLSGPRAVQFSAIWDVARKSLFFYDCNGERFHMVHLLDDTTEANCELGRLAVMREKIAA